MKKIHWDIKRRQWNGLFKKCFSSCSETSCKSMVQLIYSIYYHLLFNFWYFFYRLNLGKVIYTSLRRKLRWCYKIPHDFYGWLRKYSFPSDVLNSGTDVGQWPENWYYDIKADMIDKVAKVQTFKKATEDKSRIILLSMIDETKNG